MKGISANDLFMNVFNFSAIGMAIVSFDGKMMKVNSSLCKGLGYSKIELENMTFQEITHHDDIELDLRNRKRLLHGEIEYYELIKRYRQKNGSIVWGLLTVSLVKDDDDTPLYFITQVKDITEQKELHEKLKASEEKYRNLVQYSPEPMAIHSDGRLVYINEAGVKLMGANSYTELIGQDISDFIHMDDVEKVFQRISQTITENQHLEPYDIKILDTKGNEIVVRLSSVPIDLDGKKAIQVFLSDMTQRKKMEEAIRRNEVQYQSLIKYNPDAVFGVDLEGNFTIINESCTRITGYSEEEFLRMSFHSIVVEEDLEKAMDSFEKTLLGIDKEPLIVSIQKKNGDTAIVSVTSIPMIVDGAMIGVYVMAKDVTEQKRIEKGLRQSEERYRALVEHSPNAIVVHQDGKIVYANPRFTSMIKADSADEVLKLHITQYIHPDFYEIVKERIELLEKNIPVGAIEEKYVTLDGSVINVEVSATPIVYSDKPAFQVIIQDISERKEMERELNKSQILYRSVVENVKEVIFQTDLQGQWTFLNPAWESMTGYTMEESIGTPYHMYVHEKDRERYLEQFQSIIVGKKEHVREEVRYVTKEDGLCWVEVFTRAMVTVQGEIIGTLGTLNDITQRKEYEENLKESEELFRLLTEYSSDLITMHDVNGDYIYASPACKDILQYDVEELIGKSSFDFVHPEDQELAMAQFQLLFETGDIVFSYRIRRKDGEYVWLECSCTLLNEIHSGEQKLVAVSRNINKRKMDEQKLKEANEILKRLTTIDGLTGVANRRAFDERLEMEWIRGRRNASCLSLIMLDIDYFKAYNDTYGHQGGDRCLKQIAAAVKETLGRSTDILCRYGGEEFCVILPETDQAGANIVGEKIRQTVEKMYIPHPGSEILSWVTVSVGTATMIPTLFSSSMDLVSMADKALYKAKKAGRNNVQSF